MIPNPRTMFEPGQMLMVCEPQFGNWHRSRRPIGTIVQAVEYDGDTCWEVYEPAADRTRSVLWWCLRPADPTKLSLFDVVRT